MLLKIIIYIIILIGFIFLAFHINQKIKATESKTTASKTSLQTLLGITLATIIPYIIDLYFYKTSIIPFVLYVTIIPILLYFLKRWRILFGFVLAYIAYLIVVGIFFLLSVTNFSL